ncbi:saccharopine dehydrogenase NADP-binding domain-containing protein [Actinoallomurus vinaceus]|uniref:Saccharopine dehydrogenase NADP-binding domain-containing protein n=1 Tax=Actinoallomurus vinaceus TaxID=1080074 RepID=A0ABP8UL88_9ACTN
MKIVVYGAGGYTGRLVVAELARRGIDVVLSGRDQGRLRAAAVGAGVPDAELRVAQAGDAAALRGCDVVINCAGPFVVTGDAVIRAAITAGCHYVDIAGEQLHMHRTFDTFTGPAEKAGVSVVPGVNDDGLPADLLAHLVAEQAGTVEEVVIGVHLARGGGAPSRGTLRTALTNIDTFSSGGLGYEDGRWHEDIPTRRDSMAFPGDDRPAAVRKFPLPGVVTVPRHVPARHVSGVAKAELVAAFSAITPELLDAVPEGPADEHRSAGRWTLVVEATGREGGRARGVAEGSDIQGSTAVIAVEAAHRLAVDGAASGVLAPAQAFKAADFLDALAPYGVTWSVATM